MTAADMTLHSFSELAGKLASHIAANSKPLSPVAHLIPGAGDTQLFIPNGSRLHTVNSATETYLASLIASNNEQAIQFELAALGFNSGPFITDVKLKDPPLHALSLAIAQKCNMGCSYCYANQGDFGGAAKKMPLDTALKSIDLLLKDKAEGERVQLTFLGGEPLMNRRDIRYATVYAAKKAAEKKIDIGFSITSNGTLITEEDGYFFEQYGFALTISLDGLREEHNMLRPLKNGAGSYDRIIEKIKPLIAIQKKMQVSARVTVTPQNMNIATALDELIDMGFHSVGFSQLLKASDGKKEMSAKDLYTLLAGMIEYGLKFEKAMLQKRRYTFLNMINALKEIGKATHRPYPCGAGAGYMGVSADGELAACHRFVNNGNGNMGNVDSSIDPTLQNKWLEDRHVHNQKPCSGCWARYLCGGSCHHEVIDNGRLACDYIRGWLHFVIQSHERINRLVPGWNK